MERTWVALVVLCLLVACDGGTEPTAEQDRTPEPTAIESVTPTDTETPVEPACSNQEDVVADPRSRVGGVVDGDVDGDGDNDEVSLALDDSGEAGCRAFVVVDTGAEVLAAPTWEVGPDGGLPRPRIVGLVDVDGAEGSEIVVAEAAGASTEFAGLFVVTGGVLERVTHEGSSDEDEDAVGDLFAYGGSVGHIEGVGCAGEGTLVSSIATPGTEPGDLEEGIYAVERRLFVFDGATLVDAGIQQERISIEELEQFPEFASGPFGTCGEG